MTKEFLKLRGDLRRRSERAWLDQGGRRALHVFHRAAKEVPAYGHFLKKNGVRASSIQTIEDFKQLPTVNKENYLRAYPLNELLPKGDLSSARIISTSSGSSGIPYYWPRGEDAQKEAALIHELLLVEYFRIDKFRTLFVNTFAMGMWVAGTTTYSSIERIADHYDMTLVTPGIDLEQIIRLVEELRDHFDQVIIAGYPPFVKDIVDASIERRLNWKKLRLKFLFAAESFSESWRDHLCRSLGIVDPIFSTLNIYGTADALILGYETPLSIMVRRLITKGRPLHERFFGQHLRVPTFVQYNPLARYFEELPESKLIFTAQAGIPLIRYDIGDTGNIFSRGQVESELSAEGVDLNKELSRHKGLQKTAWNLPFITIYGRDRMTASLYGLKIYPEHVRGALESGVFAVSGRFVMRTMVDKNKNQYLEINIECKSRATPNRKMKLALTKRLVAHLERVNSEYRKLREALGGRAVPKLIFHSYGNPVFFGRNGKQRWNI